MKRIFAGIIAIMLSSSIMAAQEAIGYVDVVSLFNKSSYVAKANKELQDNVKKMEAKLEDAKSNLQGLINKYEKAAPNKKTDLAKQVTEAQTELAKLNQSYQQKIQEEQNSGLQKFTSLVQNAVAKIAKQKSLNTVLNKNAILYTDGTWMDITNDVSAAMPAN